MKKKLKNSLIQNWWICWKESQRWKISVLMNIRQDIKMLREMLIEQR